MTADRVVRKRQADGSIKEYRYVRQPRDTRYIAGTLGALLISYRISREWLMLKPTTRAHRNVYLRDLEELHAEPLEDIRQDHLKDIHNAINAARGPGAANAFLRAAKQVFNWAIAEGKYDRLSPAARIKPFPGGKLPAFSRAQFDKALQKAPEPLRRLLVLARYTGQRRADLCALTWGVYDGQFLRFTQQKTRVGKEPVKLSLFVHPDLKAELDTWKAEAEGNVVSLHGPGPIADRTILLNFWGQAWEPQSLSRRMREWLEQIGLRKKGERGLNTHGLRKMVAAILAEEGATPRQIMGVTGHKTLAMIQLYTESAEQERLGREAIMRLPQRKSDNQGNS